MLKAKRIASWLNSIALIISLSWPPGSNAFQQDISSMGREEAEQRLASLRHEIDALQEKLESARTEYLEEQNQLRDLDLRIDSTSKSIRSLATQQSAQERELENLEAQRNAKLEEVRSRKDELAEIVRAAYRLDSQSRLKLVLNQDDPAALSRILAYYEYFNRGQIEKIRILRDSLAALEAMHEMITSQLEQLEITRRQLEDSMRELQSQRTERASVVAALDQQIDTEAARLEELKRNRQDLVSLLERLEDALSDIPADLGAHTRMAQQKGQLPMPVAGRVRHGFGNPRRGEFHWQGWLIGAEPGTEVTSIAYGRVAFSDWLRGYGLMVIIDHGDGFLSLYGNNESLLHEVGDWVEPGELISVVGNNPGMTQGLYFELRKDGKAIDPAAWIKR